MRVIETTKVILIVIGLWTCFGAAVQAKTRVIRAIHQITDQR